MESNVWQLIVRAVGFLSNLFTRLNETQKQGNGGVSQNAQENDADSTLTSMNVTSLAVVRDTALQTSDAFFGRMYWKGNFLCYTMERIAVAIPEGVYPGHKRDSAHFDRIVVGIDVPSRTDIECHVANYPSQLEGCIGVGEKVDNDCLDNSEAAFECMMSNLPQDFTVQVSSI